MAPEDGNYQDIAVADKSHAALAATEEAQDVSRLNRIVVPMPSFTDPNLPEAAGGSINLELDEHPIAHDPDYGSGLAAEGVGRDVVNTTAGVHTKQEPKAVPAEGEPGRKEALAKHPDVELPEDRGEWQKKHWQARARQLGLGTSGNFETVQKRVEEHEAVEEEYAQYKAEDWKNDIDAAETDDDLTELRAAYDRSGADFSTVASAFESKQADLSTEDDET